MTRLNLTQGDRVCNLQSSDVTFYVPYSTRSGNLELIQYPNESKENHPKVSVSMAAPKREYVQRRFCRTTDLWEEMPCVWCRETLSLT